MVVDVHVVYIHGIGVDNRDDFSDRLNKEVLDEIKKKKSQQGAKIFQIPIDWAEAIKEQNYDDVSNHPDEPVNNPWEDYRSVYSKIRDKRDPTSAEKVLFWLGVRGLLIVQFIIISLFLSAIYLAWVFLWINLVLSAAIGLIVVSLVVSNLKILETIVLKVYAYSEDTTDELVVQVLWFTSSEKARNIINSYIDREIDKSLKLHTSTRNVVFVGHSLGSLIALNYLNSRSYLFNSDNVHDLTDQNPSFILQSLVTMGSPIRFYLAAINEIKSNLMLYSQPYGRGNQIVWFNLFNLFDPVAKTISLSFPKMLEADMIFDLNVRFPGFEILKSHVKYWNTDHYDVTVNKKRIRMDTAALLYGIFLIGSGDLDFSSSQIFNLVIKIDPPA